MRQFSVTGVMKTWEYYRCTAYISCKYLLSAALCLWDDHKWEQLDWPTTKKWIKDFQEYSEGAWAVIDIKINKKWWNEIGKKKCNKIWASCSKRVQIIVPLSAVNKIKFLCMVLYKKICLSRNVCYSSPWHEELACIVTSPLACCRLKKLSQVMKVCLELKLAVFTVHTTFFFHLDWPETFVFCTFRQIWTVLCS